VCEHARRVSRNTTLLLVILAAGVGLFAFSSAAQRLRDDEPAAEESVAAGPQTLELDWRETFGTGGERVVFEVKRLEVLRDGWRARLALKNESSIAWEVGDPRATLDRSFGLMLFASGKASELAERNSSGTLPKLRAAASYEPSLPEILEPRTSWKGVISAPGSLVAGSWVRVVFGTLIAIGPPPEGLEERIVWITDHTTRLRR
jgi:hypothetical protein